MWLSVSMAAVALVGCCWFPLLRNNEGVLALASVLVFVSLWLDKGVGLIVAGFVPSPLSHVTVYTPTAPEWAIVARYMGDGRLHAYGLLQDHGFSPCAGLRAKHIITGANPGGADIGRENRPDLLR